jgi:hypothetical protein
VWRKSNPDPVGSEQASCFLASREREPPRTSRGILITAFISVHLWLIGLSLAIASTIVLLLALMNPVSAESPLTFVLNWHRNVGNISSNSKIKEVR